MKIVKFFVLITLIFSMNLTAQQDDGTLFVYAKKLMSDSLFDLAAEQFHQFSVENSFHPKAAESMLFAGKCYYRNGQYDSAIKEFTLLITRFPDSELLDQAHFELAKSFKAIGNLRAAAKTFHQVFIFYPKSDLAKIALLKSAQKFFQLKESDQAKRIIYDLQESFPSATETFESRLILTKIFMQTNHFDRAENEINKLLALTSDGIVHAKALLLKAQLQKQTGRNFDAEQSLRQLIEKYEYKKNEAQWTKTIEKAYFELAEIQSGKGFYDLANENLLKISANRRDATILFLLADNFIKSNQLNQAATLLANLTNNAKDTLNFIKANYLRGFCFSKLQDFYQANQSLAQVIDFCQKADYKSEYYKLSIGLLAENYKKNRQYTKAIKLLNDFIQHFSDNSELANAKFLIGKIYQQNLKEFDRAIRYFDDILMNFPKSKLVDDAQFEIARCFAEKREYEQAINEYNRLINNFPASPYVKIAQEDKQNLQNFVPTTSDVQKSVDKLIESFVGNKNNAKAVFGKIAEIYFTDLKQYNKAIHFWRKFLSNKNLTDEEISRTNYFIGKSYLFLAQGDTKEITSSLNDSAIFYFDRVLHDFPSSEWADDAAIEKIKIFKSKISSDSVQIGEYKTLLTDFVTKYPNSPGVSFANFEIAELILGKGVNNSIDSLEVESRLDNFGRQNEDEKEKYRANLLRAKLLYQMKNDGAANKILLALIDDKQNENLCETLMLLVKQKNLIDNAKVKQALANFVENYFYSPCVDELKLKLGEVYLTQNNLNGAKGILEQLYAEKNRKSIFVSKSERTIPENLIYLLGKIYALTNEREKAISFYQKYLDLFPSGKHKAEVLFALGHLFSTREPDEKKKAIDYFNQLINEKPDTEFADSATVKIGDLYFQLEDYNRAAEKYLKIVQKSPSGIDVAYSDAKYIMCQFRLGKISDKLIQIKEFKKKYGKKHPLVADLMLEAGSHFIKQKNFKKAEDVLKDVRSDFKKTSQAARAEYLLGKMNFILNKDEEALEILTKMIKKYPNHEKIVADAYIALGNFYYLQAKQVQNALFAYQKVTQLKNTTIDQERLAKNNVIRCYTDMRMREQAVSAIYDYLDRFPDAEDAFEKKILLGILYYELREYDRALALLKKLKYEADIENEPRIQYWIGECYAGKGDFKRAVSEYLKVAYLSRPTKLNWGVTAQFQAGVAYMKAGNPAKAKEIFAKIVRRHGKDSVFGKPAQAKIREIEAMLKENKN